MKEHLYCRTAPSVAVSTSTAVVVGHFSKTFKNVTLKSLGTSRHLWAALIQWVFEKSIAQPVPGLH